LIAIKIRSVELLTVTNGMKTRRNGAATGSCVVGEPANGPIIL
jgi:hypothetical protein